MKKQLCVAPSDIDSSTLPLWIDAVEKLDAAGWPLVLLASTTENDPLDGLALAAFCAAKTSQIGLCAGVDPETVEPFTLARGLAALDHFSHGRAAWYFVAATDPTKATELVDATQRLLVSWDADAVVEDAEAGLFSNSNAVHPVNFAGAFYSVTGPLSTPQPPQGAPPLITLPDHSETKSSGEFVLDEEHILRCSLAEISNALDRAPKTDGASLRQRLGVKQ